MDRKSPLQMVQPAAPPAPARNRQKPTTFSNARCIAYGTRVLALPSLAAAARSLLRLARRLPAASAWSRQARTAAAIVRAASKGICPRSVFMLHGNSKLPFASFATLSVVDCNDKGACGAWCYSRKAWRHPAAYFRQLVNSLLMRYAPELVAAAFLALPDDVSIVRLYTDGDFRHEKDVRFWFNLISRRPGTLAYGYSKAWDALYAARDAYPVDDKGGPAYVLNLSTGGKPQKTGAAQMMALPFVREWFAAVPVAVREYAPSAKGDVGSKRYAMPGYAVAVVEAGRRMLGRKPFNCPGDCGDCRSTAGKLHACGDIGFKVPVAIGIH